MKDMRSDFPFFTAHPEQIYLDSAATSQKPQSVIDMVTHTYTDTNANVHRALYDLGQNATTAYEETRLKVAHFIGASQADEIIFTSGTTESINLVAEGWAKSNLQRGDVIVVSIMEHHSNLVPWQRLQQTIGIELYYLPLDDDYRLDYEAASTDLDMSKVKLVTITHVSNVLGTINPIADIVGYFKRYAANARFLIDGVQSVPHIPVDVHNLGIDFLAFSSHKMLGPSGTGVLYVNQELMSQMKPLRVGSHMVENVTVQDYTLAKPPAKFEAGTPNIEGVMGLGAAIDYINSVGWQTIQSQGRALTTYSLSKLASTDRLTLYGPSKTHDRLGIFSFNLSGIHSHDVAEILNRTHVCVRTGHHCAQPLMHRLGITGTVRVSLQLYNTASDIDVLMSGLKEVQKILG